MPGRHYRSNVRTVVVWWCNFDVASTYLEYVRFQMICYCPAAMTMWVSHRQMYYTKLSYSSIWEEEDQYQKRPSVANRGRGALVSSEPLWFAIISRVDEQCPKVWGMSLTEIVVVTTEDFQIGRDKMCERQTPRKFTEYERYIYYHDSMVECICIKSGSEDYMPIAHCAIL